MEALKKTGRMDLVGFDKHCLIRPRKLESEKQGQKGKSAHSKGTESYKKSGRKSEQSAKLGKKKSIRNVHKKKR